MHFFTGRLKTRGVLYRPPLHTPGVLYIPADGHAVGAAGCGPRGGIATARTLHWGPRWPVQLLLAAGQWSNTTRSRCWSPAQRCTTIDQQHHRPCTTCTSHQCSHITRRYRNAIAQPLQRYCSCSCSFSNSSRGRLSIGFASFFPN